MATSACIVDQLQGTINELPLRGHMQNAVIDAVLLGTAQVLYQSPLLLALGDNVQRTDLHALIDRG